MLKEILNEKLITLGNKRPKYNQVVIMAGGVGSGKTFIQENLLGIDGKVLNVDDLKEKSLLLTGVIQRAKNELGIDISNLTLDNPKEVQILHKVVSNLKLDKNREKLLLNSIKGYNKPNLIFDVTMKSLSKLKTITENVKSIGYEDENIHIVWVLNDVEMAKIQNKERTRNVPEDILLDTHSLVSYTISNLLKGNIRKYIDGDFWIVFNNREKDTKIVKLKSSNKTNLSGYVKDAVYFKIKEKNKRALKISEIEKKYLDKIKSYVPDKNVWN